MIGSYQPSKPRLLRPRDAAGYCGVSVPQWVKMVEAGAAPEGIQLTKRIKVWDRAALDSWIDSLCPPKVNNFAGVD